MPSLAILISAVLVLSCGQTDRITEPHTEADDRYTHATTVDVSNDCGSSRLTGVYVLVCVCVEGQRVSVLRHSADAEIHRHSLR